MAEQDDKLEGHQEDTGASVCGTICGLYALVTVMLGIALPITYFLSGETQEKGLYLAVFHIWLYVVSLVVLFYIQVCLCGLRRHTSTGSLTTEDSVDVDVLRDLNSTQPYDEPDATPPKEFYEGHDSRSVGGNSSIHDHNIVTHIVIPPARESPAYTYHGKGVDFFLRMGLIIFGMGSVILDGFRLLQFVETDKALECYGRYFMAHTGLRLLFMFAQTFFVFKNHKLVINFKKGFVRVGLLHMVATNICIWAITVVQEGAESYAHYRDMTLKFKMSMMSKQHTVVGSTGNDQEGPPYFTNGQGRPTLPHNYTFGVCHTEKTLADQAAPYLYPCAIQFCLIVVAVIFNIYSNIGLPTQPRLPTSKSTKLIGGLCHKSNTGLFFGLIILVITCISVCFFLLYDKSGNPFTNKITILVYLGGDALVTVLVFMAVLLGFCRMRKLDKGKSGVTIVDRYLLFISVGGYLLLLVFIVVPTVMVANFKDRRGILSTAQVALYLLGFVQALVQVTFVIDGLRRSTTTRRQLKTKPGRSIVTFILICNLAMWIVNTFQLKEMHSSISLRLFYGDLAWQMIMHICFPLTAFFRFYSSVTLADIWLKAYKRKRQNSQVYKGRHDSDRYM